MQPRAKSRVFPSVDICFCSITALFYLFLPQFCHSSSEVSPYPPTVDTLRNLFLTPTIEMLSFFQQLREALSGMLTLELRLSLSAKALLPHRSKLFESQWSTVLTLLSNSVTGPCRKVESAAA